MKSTRAAPSTAKDNAPWTPAWADAPSREFGRPLGGRGRRGSLQPAAPPQFSDRAPAGAAARADRPGERPDEDDADLLARGWRHCRFLCRKFTGEADLKAEVLAAGRRIEAIRARLENLPEEARSPEILIDRLCDLQPALRVEGLGGRATDEAFACICLLAEKTHGLRPYTVQIEGAWAMLMGLLIEMRTGEGKTLTAMLAATLAAWSGVPTHVVTVNAYLARRDADFARPLIEALGLSVAVVDQTLDFRERQENYAADVVYAVNKQLAFDYLRDRIAARGRGSVLEKSAARLVGEDATLSAMRGLHFAIVDEADSILIDEARTPLVISRKRRNPDLEVLARTGLELAGALKESRDFRLDLKRREVELTDTGRARMVSARNEHALLLRGRKRREATVTLALVALHMLRKDSDYVVQDGTVAIIDENTGRFMPDRSWGHGLQQMVEAKEGVPLSDPTETIGQMTFQRFFRRYRALAGMTGTAREVAGEMWSVYRLPLVPIRPRKPSRLRIFRPTVFAGQDAKLAWIAGRTRELSASGRPVLIGARSVAASERVSHVLTAAGIDHAVLNALNDAREAAIVAEAGKVTDGAGRVTVATNMAGRGTDIHLDEAARAAGGLAILLTELHDSRRIDRQLMGRAGRQGDPGSAEVVVAWDDDLFLKANLAARLRVIPGIFHVTGPLRHVLSASVFRFAQARIEKAHAELRRKSMEADRKKAKLLAFSGPLE